MPRIFDNIDHNLLPALQETLKVSERADFCVGYFNLRGWKLLDQYVERWNGGEDQCCRLLVGMQRAPEEDIRTIFSLTADTSSVDSKMVVQIKSKLAEEFRQQLALGAPTNEDEAGLRRLAAQLRSGKLVVKLYLRHTLHAKLYLLHRSDYNNPISGYLGSSNLTFAGLSKQGELNIDVLDYDACRKLACWFEDRWEDHWCIDITTELADIIETSWAREKQPPPYHIYLKMAYHLSAEARAGLSEFRIPKDLQGRLFDYQVAAVKIAAQHINKRRGVMIGDVVGLGKTLMATTVARIFQDDYFLETLVICPKNLETMWQDYLARYRILGHVLSLSRVLRELPTLRRYRLVILDESQNLRNREGKIFRTIQEYISINECRCILLSATPYNKSYLDLSAQLRLFVPETEDLGIKPERLLHEIGEDKFIAQFQAPVRSLAAFEKSEYADDWRELMRLYLVRRTRGFIQDNYAETDEETGRRYLLLQDGSRSHFPRRQPRTITFGMDSADGNDQYVHLYSPAVVDAVNALRLPRYGLGNYLMPNIETMTTADERKQVADLGRAGARLMGFCRTNLFKRLESGGQAFLQSVDRHILRNHVFLHALENGQPVPIGTQDAALLDAEIGDTDLELVNQSSAGETDGFGASSDDPPTAAGARSYEQRAREVYALYQAGGKKRFRWLRPDLFTRKLVADLHADSATLRQVMVDCGDWQPKTDAKLLALVKLLVQEHPDEKVLIFTQFSDTADYLFGELIARGIIGIESVTGRSANPTEKAWRFCPRSNDKVAWVQEDGELRILVATDVLSEGQNLQDCHIVVNYDLPWAIIRLVQRAGRVDRIGQAADSILCYSFLPADGVERIIRLRGRVRQRLQENSEVVGSDETFFEDDESSGFLQDLFTEKAGLLDGDADTEVDLASQAYQIWKNAITTNPMLQKTIPNLPAVVYSTKEHHATETSPAGVLLYMRTAEGNDALAWIDRDGRNITQSQAAILNAAACELDTPTVARDVRHHDMVKEGIDHIIAEERSTGGQLGARTGARYRTYERLKAYCATLGQQGSPLLTNDLSRAIDDLYRYPLRQAATDTLNRQIKTGASDGDLAEVVVRLRAEDSLSIIHKDEERNEPLLICSLGLAAT